MVRLSININDECAQELQSRKAKKGISVTEAIRQAIAISKLVYDTIEAGGKIIILRDGRESEVVLL